MAVAHQGNTSTLNEGSNPHQDSPQPTYQELKSLVVQIKDPTEVVGIWWVARTELLGRMKMPANSHTTTIVEVYQMASGDLLVGTTIEEA